MMSKDSRFLTLLLAAHSTQGSFNFSGGIPTGTTSHDINLISDSCRNCDYTVEELWNQALSGNDDIYYNCPGKNSKKKQLTSLPHKKCECGGLAVGGRHSDWCALYEKN